MVPRDNIAQTAGSTLDLQPNPCKCVLIGAEGFGPISWRSNATTSRFRTSRCDSVRLYVATVQARLNRSGRFGRYRPTLVCWESRLGVHRRAAEDDAEQIALPRRRITFRTGTRLALADHVLHA